jgi:hypothetical protein
VSNSLSEIVKSEMVKLTGRENTYVSDADVVVSWMLYMMQIAAEALLVERERKSEVTPLRGREYGLLLKPA